MQCRSTVWVSRSKKHVPCGRCNFCLATRRAGWIFRLQQESKVCSSAHFVTLTYAPESLMYNVSSRKKTLEKYHVQTFFKRLRKADSKVQKCSIRYYLVGEYGPQTHQPHYHIILFNLHDSLVSKLGRIWGHGHVDIGDVTPHSIAYCCGYLVKSTDDDKSSRTFPLALMSKGLGKTYLTPAMVRWHVKGMRGYTKVGGQVGPLPRYYKDKIFNVVQKEILNQITEDKQVQAYTKTIERLAKHHPDPHGLYLEALDQKYQFIKILKNEKSKI